MKKVLLIGASSGMGKALALLYAGRGDIVGITGRRGELLGEIRQRYPDRIHASDFDVRSMDNPKRLSALVDEMGGMDTCIICAGIGTIQASVHKEITNVRSQMNGLTKKALGKYGPGILYGGISAAKQYAQNARCSDCLSACETTYPKGGQDLYDCQESCAPQCGGN